MNLIYRLGFPVIILLLFVGCTTLEPETFESFSLDYDKPAGLNSDIQFPEVEIFISAPFIESDKRESLPATDVELPIEDLPAIVVEDSLEIEVENPTSNILEKKPVVEVSTEPLGNHQPDASLPQNNIVQIPEKVNLESSEFNIPEINHPVVYKEFTVEPGESLVIEIEKEGWIFLDSAQNNSVSLKNKEFTSGKTLFIFKFSDYGEYQLDFKLQNLSDGSSETIEFLVQVEKVETFELEPVVIDSLDLSDTPIENPVYIKDIAIAVNEEYIPGILASFEELFENEDLSDINLISKAYDLLLEQGGYNNQLLALAEKTFQYFPFDNRSAGMLFNSAQLLEQPGPDQDIEKALTIFKLVRDRFPISVYSDKSEERIRYLERHFMKIY